VKDYSVNVVCGDGRSKAVVGQGRGFGYAHGLLRLVGHVVEEVRPSRV
jgi:hypothetical protein